jgi:hypothetical protein
MMLCLLQPKPVHGRAVSRRLGTKTPPGRGKIRISLDNRPPWGVYITYRLHNRMVKYNGRDQ